MLLLSLPFASFLPNIYIFFYFFLAAHGFCLCGVAGIAEEGSTVVHCVKLMMRQSSASSPASLLCSRNGNEMSTKCRSKDAFINSPGTWSRLTAILRTRTRPATPTFAPKAAPRPPMPRWEVLAFLKAFCCCVSQKGAHLSGRRRRIQGLCVRV